MKMIFSLFLIISLKANATTPDCEMAQQSANAAHHTFDLLKSQGDVSDALDEDLTTLLNDIPHGCADKSHNLQKLAHSILDQAMALNQSFQNLLSEELVQQIYSTVVALEGASY